MKGRDRERAFRSRRFLRGQAAPIAPPAAAAPYALALACLDVPGTTSPCVGANPPGQTYSELLIAPRMAARGGYWPSVLTIPATTTVAEHVSQVALICIEPGSCNNVTRSAPSSGANALRSSIVETSSGTASIVSGSAISGSVQHHSAAAAVFKAPSELHFPADLADVPAKFVLSLDQLARSQCPLLCAQTCAK